MKIRRLLLTLLCLAMLAAPAAIAEEARPDLNAFPGWELVAWQVVEGSGYGFASLKSGRQNILAAFEQEGGAWAWRFTNINAFPDGEMRMELQDVSGAQKTAASGDTLDFDSQYYGSALMTYWSNGEYYENICVFEKNGAGRFLLTHYAHAGQSGEMDILEGELVFFNDHEKIERVKVKTERDLERFNLARLPKTAQQAAQPDALPPVIPDGWLNAREMPLQGDANIPVLSAPYGGLRAAGGKAAVSPRGWAQVFGVEDGYAMIQYAIGPGHFRIGYIPDRYLEDWRTPDTLGFSRVKAKVTRKAEATDDPLGKGQPLAGLAPGQEVTLLSRMGGMAYFEGREGGKAYRAFAPLTAFDEKPAPPRPQRLMAVAVEGQEEPVLMTRYTDAGLPFTIWFDAKHFTQVQAPGELTLDLQDNRLNAPVSLKVRWAERGDRTLSALMNQTQAQYVKDGWEVSGLDPAGMMHTLEPAESPLAFLARKGAQTSLVYLARTTKYDYTAVLTYPAEAAEGWGARMEMMLRTLEEARFD